MACTEIKLDSTPNSKKLHALAHAIEQVLYDKNLKLITPFGFQRNLTVYSITNSKDVARLTGCWKNSGSYTTLSQIVASPMSTNPMSEWRCPQYDRQQSTKVGRTSGRIKKGPKVPTSICTTVCHITPQPTTTFQEVDLLMPSKWLDMTKLEEILVKVETLVHSAKTEFRKCRGSYINETISVVVNEQFETGDACISDYVDIAICQVISKVI